MTRTDSPDSPRVLLSAFEPFGDLAYNPSQDVVDELMRRHGRQKLRTQTEHDGLRLATVTLPVEYGRAGELLTSAVSSQRPDVLISVGLAAGRSTIGLERVALNLRDARIADNAGAQPADDPVVPGGDTALFSTLRVKAALARITAAGLPAELSLSAGTFVCNDVFYTALHHIGAEGMATRAGFVHVPDLHTHDASLTVDETASAVDLLLSESLKTVDDDDAPAGPLH